MGEVLAVSSTLLLSFFTAIVLLRPFIEGAPEQGEADTVRASMAYEEALRALLRLERAYLSGDISETAYGEEREELIESAMRIKAGLRDASKKAG